MFTILSKKPKTCPGQLYCKTKETYRAGILGHTSKYAHTRQSFLINYRFIDTSYFKDIIVQIDNFFMIVQKKLNMKFFFLLLYKNNTEQYLNKSTKKKKKHFNLIIINTKSIFFQRFFWYKMSIISTIL